MEPLVILVAGPYRSGTGDDPEKLAAHVRAMNEVALGLFRAGHLAVTGEALALPLLEAAGGAAPGDPLFDEIFHPVAERLLARCDAVLRIGGPSQGADRMVQRARALGKRIYADLADVPAASEPRISGVPASRAPGAPDSGPGVPGVCRAGVPAATVGRPPMTGYVDSPAGPGSGTRGTARHAVPGTPGIDTPDPRGRTGLDRQGRDLDGNDRVRVVDVEELACDWSVLRRTTFDYRHGDGHVSRERRETYDRGDGATILLYDPDRRTVLLTRQFRLPAYVNGHPDGMLLEAAAGLLDGDDPPAAIRREAAEETGRVVHEVEHLFDAFMSPGSVTERLSFFAAPYDACAPGVDTAGVAAEGEDIAVVELPFAEALDLVRTGAIADAKTVMLLQWAALDGPFGPPAVSPRSSR